MVELGSDGFLVKHHDREACESGEIGRVVDMPIMVETLLSLPWITERKKYKIWTGKASSDTVDEFRIAGFPSAVTHETRITCGKLNDYRMEVFNNEKDALIRHTYWVRQAREWASVLWPLRYLYFRLFKLPGILRNES